MKLDPFGLGDGWLLISMHDPAMRRGIWIRLTPGILEICAGREGNDHLVKLSVGDTLDSMTLAKLYHALDVGRWMVEEDSDRLLELAEKRARGE